MDAFEAISKKLEVREFASRHVPGELKKKVLEAARLTGSAMNKQTWRFILVEKNLQKLSQDSTTGRWVGGADFAVIILTDPKFHGHLLDAGRALQDMQVAAWSFGVASGIYLGVDEPSLRRDFAIPDSLQVSAVLGFGYPKRRLLGKKNRKPLDEVAFAERYGQKIKVSDLS